MLPEPKVTPLKCIFFVPQVQKLKIQNWKWYETAKRISKSTHWRAETSKSLEFLQHKWHMIGYRYCCWWIFCGRLIKQSIVLVPFESQSGWCLSSLHFGTINLPAFSLTCQYPPPIKPCRAVICGSRFSHFLVQEGRAQAFCVMKFGAWILLDDKVHLLTFHLVHAGGRLQATGKVTWHCNWVGGLVAINESPDM